MQGWASNGKITIILFFNWLDVIDPSTPETKSCVKSALGNTAIIAKAGVWLMICTIF